MAMKLSTGKVAFPIEFDNGDSDCIYFNPNDKDFREGFFNFEKGLAARTKKIDLEKYTARLENDKMNEIKINSFDDILELSQDELKKLRDKSNVIEAIDDEYENAIMSELDSVFKNNVSSVIFKYCKPLDIVVVDNGNGEERESYIMHFARQFAKALESYSTKNNAAVNKYMEKYSQR